jgi:hypothetical protein
MVPEKVSAFGDAAEIMIDAWAKWQRRLLATLKMSTAESISAYTWWIRLAARAKRPAAMMPLHNAATIMLAGCRKARA